MCLLQGSLLIAPTTRRVHSRNYVDHTYLRTVGTVDPSKHNLAEIQVFFKKIQTIQKHHSLAFFFDT